VVTERWERETPQAWELPAQRADAEIRARQLDRGIVDVAAAMGDLEEQVRAERVKVAELEALLAQRQALLFELIDLERRQREAVSGSRRAERALAAEQRRAAARTDDGERVRHGRLVRVLADDGAWTVVRVQAERERCSLGLVLAHLVAAEVIAVEAGDAVGSPAERRRRSPGEREPVAVPHSLRVFADEDVWQSFRVAAAERRLTLGRYVGELVEAEAYRLGWRAGVSG